MVDNRSPSRTGISPVIWSPADASLTRPANATNYAIHGALGSAASALFKWTNFFRDSGGFGYLTGLRLDASVAGIVAGDMGAVRAWLFNAAPATPPGADQVQFATLAANSALSLGYVDFPTWLAGGTGSDVIRAFGQPVWSPMPLIADPALRDLYAIFEAAAVFAPKASAILMPYASADLG